MKRKTLILSLLFLLLINVNLLAMDKLVQAPIADSDAGSVLFPGCPSCGRFPGSIISVLPLPWRNHSLYPT